jgi:2-iminobutanoate/2-iminopropanoate deaminase|nr:RidA family protein [Candidatus Acidoferrales bacterium]
MPSRAKKRTNKTKSAKPATKRQYIIRPGRTTDFPFSDGVWAGSTFYLSGHLGIDRTLNLPPENVEDEARLMLDTFQATLAAAKLRMTDLVYVQIFCSDVSLFARFNAVYRTYFGKNFPTRAFIGSGPLLFGAHFEIQGIATRN